jgi:thioredoxin-related protein
MSQIGMEIAKKYGIRGIPTLMAFNGNGRMIFSRTGAFRVEETVQEVSNIRGYD